MIYDYIFCGFGLSAMIVLDELIEAGLTEEKSILILDRISGNSTDKTWCFWEEGQGKWDAVLRKTWHKAIFKNNGQSRDCLEGPMQYKMIDAHKLRALLTHKISRKNVALKIEKVISVEQRDNLGVVCTDCSTYFGHRIFNSIGIGEMPTSKHPLLLQHFVGWYIKTEESPFAVDTAILMDFSIAQQSGTRFMYVLPLSDTELLIEFTLFSPSVLQANEYETEIRAYLKKCGIGHFEISDKESGIIPMTTYPFWKINTKNILYIGTAGGWTKSATGYTFNSANLKARRLVQFLRTENPDFRHFHRTNRFYFYDRLFVKLLYSKNAIGYELFTSLFMKSSPRSVLRFLDEKSTYKEDLKVILACPKKPFLKVLLEIVSQAVRLR